MGKSIFKAFAFHYLIIIFFSCVPGIKISELYKYNTVNNNFYQTYQNDTLKISIDFSGAHKYQNIATSKKVVVNDDVVKTINKLTTPHKASLIFYSKSRSSKLGYAYYGFLVKKKYLKVGSITFKDYQNVQNSKFSISPIIKYKNSLNTIAVIPLVDYYVVFINTIRFKDFSQSELELDSLYLTSNTYAEISSVLTDSLFTKNVGMKNEVTNSINKNLYDRSSYIQPIKRLHDIKIDSFPQLKSFYYQSLLTRISFLDNLDSINESQSDYLAYLRMKAVKKPAIEKVIVGYNVSNNFAKIVAAKNFIMINESHYDFRNRYFLYISLDSLYAVGYRHLCLEDYSPDKLSTQLYPKKTDGFYIQEPFMAELIRKAKSKGFLIHSYEDTSTALLNFSSEIEKREYNQAHNLNKLYNSDKAAKWIVYAGYEHINKKSFMNIYKSCAQYFYDLSGVNPFCINQTYFSSLSNSNNYLKDKEVGYYTIDPASTIYSEQQADLYIINNLKSNPWSDTSFNLINNVQTYILNPNIKTEIKGNTFVYIKTEYLNLHQLAIPIFIATSVNYERIKLSLPINDYVAFFTDSDEKVIYKYEITAVAKQSAR